MMVRWANDCLLQANDGKMLVNDGEMLGNDDEMLVNDGEMLFNDGKNEFMIIHSFHHHCLAFTIINAHFTIISLK